MKALVTFSNSDNHELDDGDSDSHAKLCAFFTRDKPTYDSVARSKLLEKLGDVLASKMWQHL